MAATITTTTTTQKRGAIAYKGLKHIALPVAGVSDGNTLTSDSATAGQKIPLRIVNVAWEPDSSAEPVGVTYAQSGSIGSEVMTITLNTDGATSYDGTLHIWFVNG